MAVLPSLRAPRARTLSALVGTLLFLGIAAPTLANHVQTDSGRAIVFDHVTGNEWWVEVALSGQDAGSIASVEAQDTGGPWTALAKKSWGPYAASFHLEPGNQVRFRASWAGGAQQVSCWFTHAAGVEQCAAPPPPPPPTGWQTTPIGDAGTSSYLGDMSLADADNDGRVDVVVARSNGLRTFEWNGTAWSSETLSTRLFDAVAAGDGDGDGTKEIYGVAVTVPDLDLTQYSKVAGTWVATPILPLPYAVAGDMTLGDIDGVAGPELYIGLYDTECNPETQSCTSTTTINLVRKSSGIWSATPIATLNGHLDSMWIGDGDNDGSLELYVGRGTLHADHTDQVKRVAGTWQVTSFTSNGGSDSGYALVVVGDGDRDGRNEVYRVNSGGVFLKYSYGAATGWTYQEMFGSTGMVSPEGGVVNPTSLFLGDADNDGSQELYLATARGELYQVRWSGSQWVSTRIAYPDDAIRGKGGNGLLVVGDGDADGRREAFLAVAFVMPNTAEDGVTHVYKVGIRLPTGFDATFTGVRGNEWWEQASVTATGGTLSRVDVRLNGGAWQPLTKQSWGGYAASYRAVQGTIVQFQATSATGATDPSECYRWIPASNTDAAKVACGPAPPPPPTGFDATFSNVKGNEYWVEAVIKANAPINGVFLHVDCQPESHDMTYKADWGKWTLGGTRIPPGSKVVMTAYGGDGSDADGGYIWPNATPTSGC